MQLDLPFLRAEPPAIVPQVDFVRMRRAKRYIIRVRTDGSLRITIPRGGSRREAESFLNRHRQWAERQRVHAQAHHAPARWAPGDEILLRGRLVPLAIERCGTAMCVTVGSERVGVRDAPDDVRPAAEACLRAAARRELIPRLLALAREHAIDGLAAASVTIRNQASRWGSCSPTGAIALNFRLVQVPDAVRDYVLIHELMHLKQPNHSRRFWRLVEGACPAFREAERWLRTEGRALF